MLLPPGAVAHYCSTFNAESGSVTFSASADLIDCRYEPVAGLRHISTRIESAVDSWASSKYECAQQESARLGILGFMSALLDQFLSLSEAFSDSGLLCAMLWFKQILRFIECEFNLICDDYLKLCHSDKFLCIEVLIDASMLDAFTILSCAMDSSRCSVVMAAYAKICKDKDLEAIVISPEVLRCLYVSICPNFSPTIAVGSLGVLLKGLNRLPIDCSPEMPVELAASINVALDMFIDHISVSNLEIALASFKETKRVKLSKKRKIDCEFVPSAQISDWILTAAGNACISAVIAVVVHLVRTHSGAILLFGKTKSAVPSLKIFFAHLYRIGCISTMVDVRWNDAELAGYLNCGAKLILLGGSAHLDVIDIYGVGGAEHYVFSSSVTDCDISNQSEETLCIRSDIKKKDNPEYPLNFEEIIAIDTKVVPQHLIMDANTFVKLEDNKILMLEHYFYQFLPCVENEKALKDLLNCDSCSMYSRAISNTMIAFLRPLPEKFIDEGFELILRREIVLKVSLSCKGCHKLPFYQSGPILHAAASIDKDKLDNIELLSCMQRFHKAVACWEVATAELAHSVIPFDIWTRHCGGAYYIILPVALTAPSVCYDHNSSSSLLSLPIMSHNWKQMIRESAASAAELTRNLYDMEKNNEMIINGNSEGSCEQKIWYPQSVPNYGLKPSDLCNKLFCRYGNEWYIGVDAPGVAFTDVMKYIAVDVAPDNAKIYPVEVMKVMQPFTFNDHYRKNSVIPADDLDRFSADPNHRLVECFPVSRKITLQMMLQAVSTNINNKPIKHNHIQKSYLPAEYTCVLGNSTWFFMGQYLPSCIWRIQSLLLCIEACNYILSAISVHIAFETMQYLENLKFLPAKILESLTPRLSIEGMNSERLEVLGDSVLKLVVTKHLFSLYPLLNEGQLTFLRMKFISNENLYKCSIDLQLYQYIRAQVLSDGKQAVHLLPSGISSPDADSVCDHKSVWNKNLDSTSKVVVEEVNKLKFTQVDTENREQPCKKNYHYFRDTLVNKNQSFESTFSLGNGIQIKAKVLSDHVEALIGLFYITGGERAADALISGIGVMPIPYVLREGSQVRDEIGEARFAEKLRNFNLGAEFSLHNVAQCQQHAFTARPIVDQNEINSLQLEQILGYKFQDLSLYMEALNSFEKSYYANSFQRMEFLGDAALDCAIVELLYDNQRWANPGHISFQKSDATSNMRLAVIALELGYDKFISGVPSHTIHHFHEVMRWRENIFEHCGKGNSVISSETNSSVEHITEDWNDENDIYMKAAVEAVKNKYDLPYRPHFLFLSSRKDLKKLLADTFEAVLGAVYLDSGQDLGAIRDIILKLDMLPQLKLNTIFCDT